MKKMFFLAVVSFALLLAPNAWGQLPQSTFPNSQLPQSTLDQIPQSTFPAEELAAVLVGLEVRPTHFGYAEAMKVAANENKPLVVFRGLSATDVKDAIVCSVSAADSRFAEYPQKCAIVSRFDGARHYWVETITSANQAEILNACQGKTRCVPMSRFPVGHTHTCSRCGTSWDHAMNVSHTCQNCGGQQFVQDTQPRMLTSFSACQGGSCGGLSSCNASGQCLSCASCPKVSGKRQVLSLKEFRSGGGCANGNCGR